jgi:CheY-like chemotaxis protein
MQGDIATLKVSVQDTGVGIDRSGCAKLRSFQLFTKLRNSASDQLNANGTGLGLPLCHTLARKLGGAFDFQSTPGKGSVFWFTIEVRVVTAGANAAGLLQEDRMISRLEARTKGHTRKAGEVEPMWGSSVKAASSTTMLQGTGSAQVAGDVKRSTPSNSAIPRLQLLVVDDEKMILKVTRVIFQGTNVEISEAMNGEEALGLVRSRDFDCIIMDCNMPIMSGFECTREIRAYEQARGGTRRTPVIGHTANAETKYVTACTDVGMDVVVPKGGPRMKNTLTKTITQLSGIRIAKQIDS